MSGFVVEITSVAEGNNPRRIMWLAELEGDPSVVSTLEFAKVFPSEPPALDAAFQYKRHHMNIVWDFAVVPA